MCTESKSNQEEPKEFQYNDVSLKNIHELILKLEQTFPSFKNEQLYFLDIANRYICSIFLNAFNKKNRKALDKFIEQEKENSNNQDLDNLEKLKNLQPFDAYGSLYRSVFPATIMKSQEKTEAFLLHLKMRYILYIKYSANEPDSNSKKANNPTPLTTLNTITPKNYYDTFCLKDYTQVINKVLRAKRDYLEHSNEINKKRQNNFHKQKPLAQVQYLQVLLCFLPPKIAEMFVSKIKSYTVKLAKKHSITGKYKAYTKDLYLQYFNDYLYPLHELLQREKSEYIHQLVSTNITNRNEFSKNFIKENFESECTRLNIPIPQNLKDPNIPFHLNKLSKEHRKRLLTEVQEKKNQRKYELVGYNKKLGEQKVETTWYKDYTKFKELHEKSNINDDSLQNESSTKFYKPIPFKRIYYFIGQKNIESITNYIQKHSGYSVDKIKFAYIEKFYNANLAISSTLRKYSDIILNDNPWKWDKEKSAKENKRNKKQKKQENIRKNIRNPLAHNELFFHTHNENNNMFGLIQDYLKKYATSNSYMANTNYTIHSFNNELKFTFFRMKLPLRNGQIVKKLNYKKIKEYKAEVTNSQAKPIEKEDLIIHLDSNEPLVRVAKVWLKDLNYKKFFHKPKDLV